MLVWLHVQESLLEFSPLINSLCLSRKDGVSQGKHRWNSKIFIPISTTYSPMKEEEKKVAYKKAEMQWMISDVSEGN